MITSEALAMYQKMKPAKQALYQAAWVRLDTDLRASAKLPKKPKVYEVHHFIEAAREAFQSKMLFHNLPDVCEAYVREHYL